MCTPTDMIIEAQSSSALLPHIPPSMPRASFASTTGQGLRRMPSTSRRSSRYRHYAYACALRFWFWAPDLDSGNPYQTYNAVYRIAFYDIFRQIAHTGVFTHMGANLAYLDDTNLVLKMYNHYVHY